MADLRKLTLLHSNDMHGDFLSEKVDESLVGGVSMLSGYVNKVRSEEDNVVYVIAGDMFRGSIIDQEFRGISTVDIMNLLAPDVVGLGNHELDYGIAHLLFLEKCTKFPIVNSNLYIKDSGTRLFKSHVILNVGGMNILFIGILTEQIMADAKSDLLLGTFVNVEDAAIETGRIINSYKTMDIDFTVLITHIGFDEDKHLAQLLDPEWGVDVIVGGHSHTVIDKPEKVNDILIVQAGTGTDAIGRFDITVNCDTNSVEDFEWKLVPINEETCERDKTLEDLISSYKTKTDNKYGRVLTRFDRVLHHPRREEETELGNLFSDILYDHLGVDGVFLASGSIRKPEMGPVATVQDLMEIFPFNSRLYATKLTGSQLKTAVKFILRDEAYLGHTEFYQVSRNMRIHYDYATKTLLSFKLDGEDLVDDKVYTIAIQDYHYNNIEDFFNVPEKEVPGYDFPKCISTSDYDIVLEHFSSNSHLSARVDNRITIDNRPD